MNAMYAVDCGYLVEVVNEHTCGAGDFGQHEPGCGTVPVAPIEELLRADARLAAVEALADDPEVVERCAREAFWTDDAGGHHKPGSQPHTWENIPEVGRENYRTLIRAVLRAALHSDPSDPS